MQAPSKTASIVVPVFQNQHSLVRLADEIERVALDSLEKGINIEVVFVNDGSTDDSLAVLLQLTNNNYSFKIKILSLARNFGSIVAIRTGIKHISGNCVITLSADLQDPPSIIPRMLGEWINSSKFVICTRRSREDPIASKLFSFLFYCFVRSFILPDYPKGGFDMALLDESILPLLSASSSQLFTPIQVYSMGFRPKILYYHREKRMHGKSKWSFAKKIGLFFDIALSFSRKPARLLCLFGVLASLASFLYGMLVVVIALYSGIAVPGFATIVVLTSILFSIVILLLTLAIEYLSRIFYVLSSQPEVVIESIY